MSDAVAITVKEEEKTTDAENTVVAAEAREAREATGL